jgi:hypothetical protein
MTIKDEIDHAKQLALHAVRGVLGMLLLKVALHLLPSFDEKGKSA